MPELVVIGIRFSIIRDILLKLLKVTTNSNGEITEAGIRAAKNTIL